MGGLVWFAPGAWAAGQPLETTGQYHARGSSHSGVRLDGRGMRFGIGRAQIRDAHDDFAIRVRTGRRRSQNVDRTDLSYALRTRRACKRLDGHLCAQGIQAADGAGEARAAARHATGSGRRHHSRASGIRTEPGLRGTRKGRARPQTGAAQAEGRERAGG